MDVTPDYKIQLARDLRKRQTPSEAKLWKYLHGHQVNDLGFCRQRPIGRFVADFCCEAAHLIVEVYGGYSVLFRIAHATQASATLNPSALSEAPTPCPCRASASDSPATGEGHK